MGRITVVLIGVLYENGKFLLTRRMENGDSKNHKYNGFWQFPGGQYEFGETPEAGVVRELKEEIGVEVEVSALIPYVPFEVRKKWHGLFICYLCKRKDATSQIILNDEADMYDWVSLPDIKGMHTLKGTNEMAEEAYKFIVKNVSA